MKRARRLSPRDEASVGPRQLKDPNSTAFAWQTISLLKIRFQSKTLSEKGWRETLEEAERYHIYERVPEDKPYGSLNALLKAEIGETVHSSTEKVKARAEDTKQQAKRGEVGRGRVIDRCSKTTSNGRGADYLTARIARDHKDILERMKAGEFKSVRAAAIEAGIVRDGRRGDEEKTLPQLGGGLLQLPSPKKRDTKGRRCKQEVYIFT